MSELTKRKRLPHYERTQDPPPVELTARDKRMFETIYHYEGVLADYQLTRLFFNSQRRMQARLSLLYQGGYLDRFSRQQQAMHGFMAYFLDARALEYVAGLEGVLSAELKARGRDERAALIPHDVKLNDVRIAAMLALNQLPEAHLINWVNSRTFWADHDTISYLDGRKKEKKRAIRPDGYFHVQQGDRHSRLLLELDMRTEHNERFVEEKIYPGLTYINSEAYKERFGVNAGRWLVVTTGERRLANMKQAAEKVGTIAKAFYFTTFEAATQPGAFFTQPIWWRPTQDTPAALFTNV